MAAAGCGLSVDTIDVPHAMSDDVLRRIPLRRRQGDGQGHRPKNRSAPTDRRTLRVDVVNSYILQNCVVSPIHLSDLHFHCRACMAGICKVTTPAYYIHTRTVNIVARDLSYINPVLLCFIVPLSPPGRLLCIQQRLIVY